MSEPTLTDIAHQLQELNEQFLKFRQTTDSEFQEVKRDIKEVKQAVEKLDSRLFDFSMRIVTTNQSAFWSISIALLSAAIAFFVARVSNGDL